MSKRIKNKSRFLIIDYVEDEHLQALYKSAQLFIYPSLNEGFGYPPIEAMRYGTLCACSANTSISEVCGEMVWYFNPLDVDEISIRILESFSERIRAEKREAIARGLKKVMLRQEADLEGLIKLISERDQR